MRKRTLTALRYTQFTSESHPALVALIDYAAQNPGLDPRNYGTWSNYQTEARQITRQWHTIGRLMMLAAYQQVTDVQIIEASQWVWSGRYAWDAASQRWEYCTGQYFPCEYRAAVIAILKAVLSA